MDTTSNDVQQDSSPVVSENVTTQAPVTVDTEVTTDTATQVAGSKTPESNLLAALHEERRLRKELEDKLSIQTSVLPDTDDVYSDEGKALKGEIDSLRTTVQKLEDEKLLEKTLVQFPLLKDFKGEFETFRTDFPRHKLENVAKLFLAEKGLIGSETRIGLEKPTGGDKTPQKSGITSDELKDLRTNNFKKYQQMVSEGKLRNVV